MYFNAFQDRKPAMQCYCFLRNVVDILHTRHTPWYERFGSDFCGYIIPLGAQIEYKPITEADKKRLPKYGNGRLSGIFLVYKDHHGGKFSK